MSSKYLVVVEGTGVSAADAAAAFEAFVQALRTATDEGGSEPTGSLKHTDVATEKAADVPA